MARRTLKIFLGLAAGAGALFVAVAGPCWSAWLFDGIVVGRCPSGDPRPVIDVNTYGLERGREGLIEVTASARYPTRWGGTGEARLRRFSAEAAIEVDGERRSLECDGGWEEGGAGHQSCEASLPEGLPDGDYALFVGVDTPLGEDPEVEVELPLYTPAAIHVLTDRPLYEPGQVIRFRSLSLDRADLTPIDGRPGTWVVTGPDGRVYLEEEQPGGAWGVADGTFPLAPDADAGAWTVGFVSGADRGEAEVAVRPFTLPRFTVSLAAERPWYGVGERPRITGEVNYASGAAVSGAALTLRIAGDDAWPPPRTWLEPIELVAGEDGAFEVALPPVPDDLHVATRLSASVTATDPSGERARGGAGVLLSADPVAVSAVTELADGLVAGFSNRVYLRVTTPDGQPLEGAAVTVKRRWDPRDPGVEAAADVDGVLAMQIDPGEPVSVVLPPPPHRPPPPSASRTFTPGGVSQHLSLPAPGVAARRSMDAVADALEARCRRLVERGGRLAQPARVPGGRARAVLPEGSPLEACAAAVLRGADLAALDGLYTISWNLRAPEIPRLTLSHRTSLPSGDAGEALGEALEDAAARAAACVADEERLSVLSGARDRARPHQARPPWTLIWSLRAGDRRAAVELHVADAEARFPGAPCVAAAFRGLTLPTPADADALGATRIAVALPGRPEAARPAAQVMQGYEFEVAVEGVGETTWRSPPGAIPDVRLRPSKVLLAAGEPFEVEILRGPGFSGVLPRRLDLKRGADTVQEVELDEGSRVAAFTPSPGATGFLTVSWRGAQALVFARPAASLEVSITPDARTYRPGQSAALRVQTSAPAVVSLVGVDSRLAQLAPLPSTDDLGRSLVWARSDAPAFGRFDAVALGLGAVRGDNAARAAVARVSAVDPVSAKAPKARLSGRHDFDLDQELAEVFYAVLPDVRAAASGWEAEAASGELFTNAVAATLWAGVVEDRERSGEPASDPWGRPLKLGALPDPLLARVDPRVLVRDATRLPEDIVEWTGWVRSEDL